MNIAVFDENLVGREAVVSSLNHYFSDKSVYYSVVEFERVCDLIHEIEDGTVYDIVFLDIFLGEPLGIDAAHQLRNNGFSGAIIFLSDTSDFAVDSYDVNASGYLLKPYSDEKLCSVMDRVMKYFDLSVFQLKQRNNIIRVPFNDIMFVESRNSRCTLYTVNNYEYTVYERLNDIEKELADDRFLRCHRSFIVNMNYIIRADKQFTLTDGSTVLIRQKSLKDVRQSYVDYLAKTKR